MQKANAKHANKERLYEELYKKKEKGFVCKT